jgi:hypothetical protein
MANNRVTKDQFQTAVTAAVEQRARAYTTSFALHVRWEDDNTEAERDCANFQSFLHAFGFGPPEVLTLARDDTTPQWTVVERFTTMTKVALGAAASGRAIVFFHYAGHGNRGVNDELLFTAPSSSKSIKAHSLLDVVDPDRTGVLEDNSPVDVVFVLDCCYSFLSTKAANPIGRVVEVIAAVDSSTPGAFVPGQRVSFTGKLARQVAFLKGQNHQSIELAELVAILRAESPVRKPSHVVKVGSSSVRLYFSGVTQTQVFTGHSKLQAVFKVHIDETFTPEELQNFISWIHSLSPRAGLGLEAVYETTSMCLIIRGSYATFSKLNGIPGVSLICETSSGNLLNTGSATRAGVGPSLQDPNVPRALPGAENISPSKRRRIEDS